MKLNWIFYRVIEKFKRRGEAYYKKSYSQCGEDLIIRHVFDALRIPTPTYLDIGAHHPNFLNNTRIFYDAGSRGVNVEPDPSLICAFQKLRPRDVNLNIGIAPEKGSLPFYIMSTRTLNTFSEKDAKSTALGGKVKIEQVIDVPVLDANAVIKDNFSEPPDLISLDVEGLDLAILRSLDFSRHRPKVVCVETITFSLSRQGQKITDIVDFMNDKGYFSYADTNVNTLFVDRQIW